MNTTTDPAFTNFDTASGQITDSGPNYGLVSIRSAIAAADASYADADVIKVPAGTYGLANDQLRVSPVFASAAITFQGAGAGQTIVAGDGQHRVFDITVLDGSTSATDWAILFDGMTVEGGVTSSSGGPGDVGGAGIYFTPHSDAYNHNSLTIQNCELTVNGVTSTGFGGGSGFAFDVYGGAVYAVGGDLTIKNTTLDDNSVDGDAMDSGPTIAGVGNARGGAVYYNGQDLVLDHVSATNNIAQGAAAKSARVLDSNGQPHYISAVGGSGRGGAVYAIIGSGGTVTMTDCEFDQNTADGGTGRWYGTTVSGFADDPTGGPAAGGAVSVQAASNATDLAQGCEFSENQAIAGGGDSGSSGEQATGGNAEAGAVEGMNLLDCTAYGNTAEGGTASSTAGGAPGVARGGGVFGIPTLPPTVESTPSIPPPPTALFVYNSTIAGNTASAGYDGLGSQGSAYGGGLDARPGSTDTITLYSTIVATNTIAPDVTANGDDVHGGVTAGHNLIGVTDDPSGSFPRSRFIGFNDPVHNTNDDLVGPDGSGNPLDPRLDVLGHNGGFTQTMPLFSDSPAIDRGASESSVVGTLPYDQRDFPFFRAFTVGSTSVDNYDDGTDVGAYELLPAVNAVYADRTWAGYANQRFITDADPVATGNQNAYYGYDAFASVNDAIRAAAAIFSAGPSLGMVVVNGRSGGAFSEAVNDNSPVKMVLQYGAMSFNSLTIGPGAAVWVMANLGGTTGDGFTVSVGGLQSHGLLNLFHGSSTYRTILANTGSAEWDFYDHSMTYVSDPANTSGYPAMIDLHGVNAKVTGANALLVNNGFIGDSLSTGAVISDSGALVKGAGTYLSAVITQNGGRFQAGNSPGVDYFSAFTFGPGGVGDLNFCINNATGTAGPNMDADGHVSGWSLIDTDTLDWTADATHKLTVHLETLANPTAPGHDVAGPMDNFDPTQSYTWPALRWTGTYTGPTDVSDLNAATVFDTSGFLNSLSGTFGWRLDLVNQTLSLVYTPNP